MSGDYPEFSACLKVAKPNVCTKFEEIHSKRSKHMTDVPIVCLDLLLPLQLTELAREVQINHHVLYVTHPHDMYSVWVISILTHESYV